MNRNVHRGATLAAVTLVLLMFAAVFAAGCGGGNSVGVETGDGGDDGSGDATADGTQGDDGPAEAAADTGSDRSMPSDGGRDAKDAAEDQSAVDAPSDRTASDAPADQSSTDAPPDTSTMDVVTGCNALTCPMGCCEGNTCQPGTSSSACGAAGAACSTCPNGETCSNGACSGCNASTCPTGCCSGSTCTTPTSAMACGTAGAACTNCGSKADGCSASGTCSCGGGAACGTGQECSGGQCVCNAASCPTGCCSGTTCTTPSAMACGTGGAACTSCGTSGDGCSANGSCTCGNGAGCGSGQVCSGGKCICDAASCPTGCCQGGTTCQPGNTTAACGANGGTCQACATGDTCTGGSCVVPTPVCGDGIREAGEQCDDHNLVNLDGCDSNCQFEQVTRATQIVLQWAHDTSCTADVLLEAIKDGGFFCGVHSSFQTSLDTDVTSGVDNVVFKYFGITDLSGKTGTTSVGSYNATLTNAYTTGITGNADLDWWYTLDTTTAGASPLFTPTAKELTGTFGAGGLTASGGHVLVSAFGTSLLDLANVTLTLPSPATATKPTASTGAPPGHLASENLDGTLVSFPTAAGTNAAPSGIICGDTTALSLAQTAVPPQLQMNCKEGYTATSTMLDVFIGGCTNAFCTGGTIITKTQPDQVNPDAPAVGAGPPYTFQENTSHQVVSCQDKSGTTVSLPACEAAAAYSTYMKIAVDRVILKHP